MEFQIKESIFSSYTFQVTDSGSFWYEAAQNPKEPLFLTFFILNFGLDLSRHIVLHTKRCIFHYFKFFVILQMQYRFIQGRNHTSGLNIFKLNNTSTRYSLSQCEMCVWPRPMKMSKKVQRSEDLGKSQTNIQE